MTFLELGIPFSLFEADEEECDTYRGMGDCQECSQRGHLFAFPDKVACYACLRAGRVSYPKKFDPTLTAEHITELERTPDHEGLEGREEWPACCKRPMIYVGSTDDTFLPSGPDAVTISELGGHGTGWTYYLYRCPTCFNGNARGRK
jgi:hypothetical protein